MGHVEWVEFARVEEMPGAGEIAHSLETWEEAGSPQAAGKANAIWKELLNAYEPPPFDETRREELLAFVDRRKSEGGVPTDF